jgi:hypothetical protein
LCSKHETLSENPSTSTAKKKKKDKAPVISFLTQRKKENLKCKRVVDIYFFKNDASSSTK